MPTRKIPESKIVSNYGTINIHCVFGKILDKLFLLLINDFLSAHAVYNGTHEKFQ